MGWDAHSSAEKNWQKRKLADSKINRMFKNAEAYVKKKASSVDWYLHLAGLDCSSCAKMLEQATGESCWEDGWSEEKVKELAAKANWNFEFEKEKDWAYWSAKKFLETCAKANLSITFSW